MLALHTWANSKYPDIDKLIEKVKVQREGLEQKEIQKLKNPFIDEKKLTKIIKIEKKKRAFKKIHHKKVYRLYAIFDDRAKINGRWYRKGSRVGSYKLIAIEGKRVLLKRGKRTLTLFLHTKSKKIKLYPVTGAKR